jgi:AbrB family looped-hinge helix DNA binding protein
MQKQAKISSKGQITVPREVRRLLGVRAGDRLLFESDGKGIRVRPGRSKSTFSKYRRIGNRGLGLAEKASVVGCESCADDDNCYRYQCCRRAVG